MIKKNYFTKALVAGVLLLARPEMNASAVEYWEVGSTHTLNYSYDCYSLGYSSTSIASGGYSKGNSVTVNDEKINVYGHGMSRYGTCGDPQDSIDAGNGGATQIADVVPATSSGGGNNGGGSSGGDDSSSGGDDSSGSGGAGDDNSSEGDDTSNNQVANNDSSNPENSNDSSTTPKEEEWVVDEELLAQQQADLAAITESNQAIHEQNQKKDKMILLAVAGSIVLVVGGVSYYLYRKDKLPGVKLNKDQSHKK